MHETIRNDPCLNPKPIRRNQPLIVINPFVSHTVCDNPRVEYVVNSSAKKKKTPDGGPQAFLLPAKIIQTPSPGKMPPKRGYCFERGCN